MHSVLLIDDDEILLSALTRKFTAKEYNITLAKDGIEAMEKLSEQKYDAILTDLHMPKKDGFAVLEERGETINADTPIFVITNLGSESHCKRARDMGVKECFVKSTISLKEIVQMIHAECAS